ncbi:hypothetical protein GLOTRDRAFT_136775 [Gloeophyllum trabeum ATCC 11539]|uniref:DUF7598 domain-containing protein n=1 Tax=Gloeophyllum trabeum (strain ATCC 11539 / FP-39264 / Madison 617) TaxID=670483 RepID=S7RTF2_GLOTA|nr:uncharacterized protein GLOTRDRAFT_136775 [Gloeophyllum trabeum ATCC 11539]EPQ57960.1 hypothetical protein GLOTRDRAFT_136775 [Gloeophyllum trabeum ATCC 11539]
MLPARAYVFMGLNAVRVLSLIALTLVFSSSIVVMVHDVQAVNHFLSASSASDNSTVNAMEDCDYIEGSTVPNQPAGAFWAVLNRLLIIFQVIMLFLSEIGWPATFFKTYFPVLGKDFGLGALGVFECLIGATVLSHHVDTFTLVAAFFLFSIGCLNIVLGLIFRESAKARRSITSWRAERAGVLPSFDDKRPPFARPGSTFVSNVFMGGSEKGHDLTSEFGSLRSNKSGYGFGRQGEKAAGLKGEFPHLEASGNPASIRTAAP